MAERNCDWMGNLPSSMTNVPLVNLCIPGSHNSFTYNLNPNSPVSNDEPEWIQRAGNFSCVKRIVHNWSIMQSMSATDQLISGVRYFDFRVAQPEDISQPISIVHGQYGDDVFDVLTEINRFLDDHRKEMVILDFNHFYNMTLTQHCALIDRIIKLFGSKLCPAPPEVNVNKICISDCWTQRYQVFLFYQKCSFILPVQIWPAAYVKSPWANTDNTEELFCYLEKTLRHRNHISPKGGFFVTQGIRTVNVWDVIKKPCYTIKDAISIPTTKDVVKWLQDEGPSLRRFLNIVIVDFVETDNFCDTVIKMN